MVPIRLRFRNYVPFDRSLADRHVRDEEQEDRADEHEGAEDDGEQDASAGAGAAKSRVHVPKLPDYTAHTADFGFLVEAVGQGSMLKRNADLKRDLAPILKKLDKQTQLCIDALRQRLHSQTT
eukprot:ANDGO_03967.mRNA.1 hypothetical protein